MKSYTGRRNLFGDLVNNSSSTTLTLADTLMNMCEKRLLSLRDWRFLRRTFSILTKEEDVTVTIASPGVFTLTAHQFVPRQAVFFSTTGALPTGLTAGTVYYVVSEGLTANAFEVSARPGGTAVNTSGSQSGTHTVSTAEYILPPNITEPMSVFVTVGGTKYQTRLISSRSEWDFITQSVQSGDYAKYAFVEDGRLYLEPKPATDDLVVSLNARRLQRDLSIADYTTGTIDVITNGSTAVTGSGTTWTTPMEGRYLRVTHSDTAASSGDHFWYEIEKVVSATSLVLRRPYNGTSLTTGAAATYIIGECSLIPEPHDMLPIYDALKIYFTSIEPNQSNVLLYKSLYDEGYAAMVKADGLGSVVVIEDRERERENPNFFVEL